MHIGHRWALLAGLLVLGVFFNLSAVASENAEAVGHVTRLAGEAQVTRAGTATSLQVGALVYPHDRIQTRSGSKLELRFADGTVVTLGPETSLRVTKFVYAAASGHRSAILDFISGALRAVVSKLLPDSFFEVHTQQAVAAVRGTQWMEEITGSDTAVVTLEGEVWVRRVHPGTPPELLLTPGEGVDVKPGASFHKKRWGQKRVDALRKRTTFAPLACASCSAAENKPAN